MNNETENQTRLRRAKEALASYQASEAAARTNLHLATEATKRAREKYEALFLAEEKREQARRIATYRHTTN